MSTGTLVLPWSLGQRLSLTVRSQLWAEVFLVGPPWLLRLFKVYAVGGEVECDVLLVSDRTKWGFDKGSSSRIVYGWEANQTLGGNLARAVSRHMCGMEERPQRWLTVLGWILGGQTYYNTHPCEPHGVINLYVMIPISEASVAHADKIGDWSKVPHRWTKDLAWATSSKWSVS